MKAITHFLIFPAILSIPASFVTAQTPTESLDEIIVTSTRQNPSITVQTLEEARKTLTLTPGGVEMIDAERYLRGRSSTLADTFALSPGVVAQPRFGADEARLSIRGSGLQRTFHGRGIRVLQDGIPINLADGSFDMQSLDPMAASHINVWRGGNALAQGSSTLGGAIDYVTHTGLTAPGGSLRAEAGSFGYFRSRFAGGLTEGSTDLYFSLSHHSQSGFRDHSEQSTQRLFSNFGWKIAENAETRVYVTTVRTDSELPGNLTKAQLEDRPTQANAGNVNLGQKRDFELYRVASRTVIAQGDTRWNLTAAWTYKDLDHPIFQVIDHQSNDALLGLSVTHGSRLFGRDHRLNAGVNFTYGETDAANFQNLSGNRGPLVQKDRQTATNLEAYLESQLELGYGFTSILGASASRNTRENRRLRGNAPANSSYDRTYDHFAPLLGLRWDGPSIQVYANASGSYEPPSFSESGTSVIANKAQKANTFEIGTRGTQGAWRWDTTLYHAEIDNELLTIQLPGAALGATGTINADRTIHQGIEIGTEYDFLGSTWEESPDHRLVGRTAWTYGRFRFDDDDVYGDNRIAGLPPHLIRGELLWETSGGYYFGPTFEWVPVKSYIDHRNTYSADPYALLGFKVGRRLESGLSWFVEARNLTNEAYAATTGVLEDARGSDQAQFLPGDGRSIFAGIEWKW